MQKTVLKLTETQFYHQLVLVPTNFTVINCAQTTASSKLNCN